jgi:uncharacterized protein YwgA
MNKNEFVFKTLSLLKDKNFSPVQIQKLFFLLEKRLDVKYFDFKPCNYGPYSFELQNFLDAMSSFGGIELQNINGINHYKISQDNLQNMDDFFDEKKRNFIIQLGDFIKSLSFKELCMSIYKEFPEMAENSVFFKNKNI